MMQRLLTMTIKSITADIVYTQENIREHQGPQICGGRLKGPVGIIQTPNFPNLFPVRIKCKWIIEHDIVNGTISIYFTQQYTTSGLTFTEYMYYDESFKLGERKALTVTEENISRNNWLQGVTMLVCYVIRDEECLQSAKRILSLPTHRDWQESPVGDTFLNLFIKQGGKVESRGGVGILDSTSSQSSPVTSYWRVTGLESPARIHRRQSTPDTRANIVRCVEYKNLLLSPQRYDANVGNQHLGESYMDTAHVSTTHVVCDLIAHSHTASQRPDYMAHVCLKLGVLRPPPEQASPVLTNYVDFKPGRHFDTSKDGCSECAHSNPDVSKINAQCLKKPKQEFISSISLPSMKSKEELKPKSDIEQVNKERNKANNRQQTDRMLNKISNDLDFLLNRTEDKNMVLDQIKEAPT